MVRRRFEFVLVRLFSLVDCDVLFCDTDCLGGILFMSKIWVFVYFMAFGCFVCGFVRLVSLLGWNAVYLDNSVVIWYIESL